MTSEQLYASVKAGFVIQQTSLHKFCKENGITRQNARKALLGQWKGKKGIEVKQLLIEKSGVKVRNSKGQVANQSCELDS